MSLTPTRVNTRFINPIDIELIKESDVPKPADSRI